MAWTWRYELDSGEPAEPPAALAGETFPSQGEAESWLGENWRTLLEAGVAQVTLLDAGREIYGPMSLSPAD
jgi:hypothetical protein